MRFIATKGWIKTALLDVFNSFKHLLYSAHLSLGPLGHSTIVVDVNQENGIRVRCLEVDITGGCQTTISTASIRSFSIQIACVTGQR